MMITAGDVRKIVPIKQKGIHCSLYLPLDSYEQLLNDYWLAARRIERLLIGRLSPEEIKKFLLPLENYIHSKRLLPHFDGSLALFRTKDSFRAMKVSSWVPVKAVIASSFHIKPLIEEKQKERSFNYFSFENGEIIFFEGSILRMEEKDRFFFDFEFQKESLSWLESWIHRLIVASHRPTFWGGPDVKIGELVSLHLYDDLFHKTPLIQQSSLDLDWQMSVIRQVIKRMKDIEHDEICMLARDIKRAEAEGRLSSNLFQIARQVVSDRVETLLVASDHEVWGEIDEKTGGISIHPDQINHQDDDLLDDLAEKVIEKGGQVLVLPKEEIPAQTGILAILKRETSRSVRAEGLQANY